MEQTCPAALIRAASTSCMGWHTAQCRWRTPQVGVVVQSGFEMRSIHVLCCLTQACSIEHRRSVGFTCAASNSRMPWHTALFPWRTPQVGVVAVKIQLLNEVQLLDDGHTSAMCLAHAGSIEHRCTVGFTQPGRCTLYAMAYGAVPAAHSRWVR
jgi:hypothetical protein